MRFVSIDFETANERMRSICQVGLVVFENGNVFSEETLLVDPQDWFSEVNISIHGITEDDVKGSPTFDQIHGWLTERLSNEVVVCHTHFDRVALAQACEHHGLLPPGCKWLDSARVAKRAWPQFARAGYGLANVASHCGIEFGHHHAGEDARAAGLILLEAMNVTGLDLNSWFDRVERPIDLARAAQGVRRTGDGDGPLLGESVVFTGALTMVRQTAADLAHEAGAAVEPSVTKTTTLLVVGEQDIDKLAGHAKSSKHRKAEQLIANGQAIRILGERDFLRMCEEP